jgi:hypothetical protein
MMHLFAAIGGREDLSGPSMVLALECALVLGLAAFLAAVPVLVARRRGVAGAESILAGAALWGVVAALYAGNFVVTQFNRAREHLALLMRGFDDAATPGDAPRRLWGWWMALAVVYAALLVAAAVRKPRGPAGPTRLE